MTERHVRRASRYPLDQHAPDGRTASLSPLDHGELDPLPLSIRAVLAEWRTELLNRDLWTIAVRSDGRERVLLAELTEAILAWKADQP